MLLYLLQNIHDFVLSLSGEQSLVLDRTLHYLLQICGRNGVLASVRNISLGYAKIELTSWSKPLPLHMIFLGKVMSVWF